MPSSPGFPGALRAILQDPPGPPAPVPLNEKLAADTVEIRVSSAAGRTLHRHHPESNDWIPPAGELQPGEDPRLGAARILRDMTGYEIDPDELKEGPPIPSVLGNRHVFQASASSGRQAGKPTHDVLWIKAKGGAKPGEVRGAVQEARLEGAGLHRRSG